MFEKLNKILQLFMKHPIREFNVREAARLTDISTATTSNKLKELAKEKILKHRKERNLDLYKANIESYEYRDMKIYHNIRTIRESGLLEALNEQYMKPAVVLFGSSSTGMDIETSDIDILVVSENKKQFFEREKFKKKLGRELQIFVVSDVKELKNKHLINSAANGIVIQGMVKWI